MGGTKAYGKHTPIPLWRTAQTNGLNDALWCLGATQEDYPTVVKPFLRQFRADLFEHLALSPLPESMKTLLVKGVALLRDPATTDAQLNTYAEVAGPAARVDAWNAARAAEDAAWNAARAAAGAAGAAWDAAWTAERQWQTERFITLLQKEA